MLNVKKKVVFPEIICLEGKNVCTCWCLLYKRIQNLSVQYLFKTLKLYILLLHNILQTNIHKLDSYIYI